VSLVAGFCVVLLDSILFIISVGFFIIIGLFGSLFDAIVLVIFSTDDSSVVSLVDTLFILAINLALSFATGFLVVLINGNDFSVKLFAGELLVILLDSGGLSVIFFVVELLVVPIDGFSVVLLVMVVLIVEISVLSSTFRMSISIISLAAIIDLAVCTAAAIVFSELAVEVAVAFVRSHLSFSFSLRHLGLRVAAVLTLF